MARSSMTRFVGKEGAHVSVETLLDWVRSHPLSSGRVIPVILWGAAGIGKTQTIKAYCRSRGLEIKTYHPAHDTDGGAIVGQPYTDPETKRTTYAWPDWLPTDHEKPGVLFIDELNRANEEVLAGLMEILGEGTIAQSGWSLPDGWSIVCAANPSEVGYQVQELDEAMVNRMVHYAPGWDAPEWVKWADSAELAPEIVDFALRFQNQYVEIGEEQLPQEIIKKMRCSPRSLEYLGALYEPGMNEHLLRVIAGGLIGRDAAEAFMKMLEDGGLRPLTAEDVLAWPEQDEGTGAYRFPYEGTLELWEALPATERQTLIMATVDRVVAKLLDEEPIPSEEDGRAYAKDNVLAQMFGRFLAKQSSVNKEKAFERLGRSAPQWLEVVQEATAAWTHEFGRRGELAPNGTATQRPASQAHYGGGPVQIKMPPPEHGGDLPSGG